MRQGGLVGTVVGAVLCCAALAGCAGAGAGATEPRIPMTQRATATATETETPRAAPSDDASGTSGTGSETVTLQPVEVVAPPAATKGDSAPVAAARCIDSQLTLEYRARPQDSGAGSFYGDLVFTNVAATDCSFDGWPGVIAQSADGVQLGTAARSEGSSSAPVVLAAGGGVATAKLHGTQPGAYGCPATTSTFLRAYLASDGAGAGVSVAQSIPVCADRTGTLGVGPLIAG